MLGTYNGEEYSLVITVRQSRLEYTSYRNVMYVLKTASYYIFCRSSYPLIDNVKEEREEPHHLTICEYAEIFHKKATKTSLARAGNRITTKEKALCLPSPPRNTTGFSAVPVCKHHLLMFDVLGWELDLPSHPHTL